MSEVKSQAFADYEASGLLMGMTRHSDTFTTNRLKAARRLTGPARFPLWPLTSYAKMLPLTISMLSRPNLKPSVTFTCPSHILKLPKSVRASWSWLKGLWGSSGSLYFPKSGYYLAFIVSNTETANVLSRALKLTGLTWNVHRNEFSIRNHDDIMTFLCNAGMPSGALDFDATVMMRSVRSRANRESNCDSANIARAMRAAAEQSEVAQKVIDEGLLVQLPESLRELVELRLEYPDESLAGLGKKLSRPVTKATVNYRWSRIKELLECNAQK